MDWGAEGWQSRLPESIQIMNLTGKVSRDQSYPLRPDREILRRFHDQLFDFFFFHLSSPTHSHSPNMAKKALANDQIVKLIVGAGQASPSPPVGPALGSRGVKSMDFCKVCLRPGLLTA